MEFMGILHFCESTVWCAQSSYYNVCMAETLYFNKRENLCVGLNGALEPIKFSYSIVDKTILYMYMYDVQCKDQEVSVFH